MKRFFLCSLSILILATNCYSQNGILGSQEQTVERLLKIKRSTVQILINNEPKGTGFLVSEDGMLLTNWHVIEIQNNGLKTLKLADFINIKAITYKNDTIDFKFINEFFSPKYFNEAQAFDFCILTPKKRLKVEHFLIIGSSKEILEGTTVYTCGYPLNLKVPFISTGMLSTKFDENISVNGVVSKRNLMYLDLTLNPGNSGGALMVMGNTPQEDKVIGIVSFIVTPFFQEINSFNDYVDKMRKKGSVSIMGVDFLEFAKNVNSTLNANSVGISGSISIDCIKDILKKHKQF